MCNNFRPNGMLARVTRKSCSGEWLLMLMQDLLFRQHCLASFWGKQTVCTQSIYVFISLCPVSPSTLLGRERLTLELDLNYTCYLLLYCVLLPPLFKILMSWRAKWENEKATSSQILADFLLLFDWLWKSRVFGSSTSRSRRKTADLRRKPQETRRF